MKKVRSTAAYGAVQASLWGIYAVLVSFASNFLTEQGFSGSQVSLTLGLCAGGAILVQLSVANWIGRGGRVPLPAVLMVLATTIATGSVGMLLGWSWLRVAGFCLAAITLQALPGLINSLGMNAIRRGVPVIYSVARGGGSISYSLISMGIGLLVERNGLRMVPVFTIVTAALLLLSVALFWRVGGSGAAQEKTKSAASSGSFFAGRKWFLLLMVGSALLYFSHSVISNFMFYILRDRGYGESEQGMTAAICAISELPVMFFFAYMTRLMPCRKWVQLSGLFYAAKAAAMLAATSVAGIYAAQLFQALGYAVYTVGSVQLAAEAAPDDPIRSQSFLGSTMTIGSLLAMSTGGVICEHLGVNALLLTSTTAALVGAVLISIAVMRHQCSLMTKA